MDDPTESKPRMHSDDALAEMLGEECVRAATSGEEAYSADVDGVTTEESGLPVATLSVGEEGEEEEGDEIDAPEPVTTKLVRPAGTASPKHSVSK